MFTITDDVHLDGNWSSSTLDAALAELNRLAQTPWGEGPNRAPCRSWKTCAREWVVSERRSIFDGDVTWHRLAGLTMSDWGPQWSIGPEAVPTDVEAVGPKARRGRARRLGLRLQHRHQRI
jgi:hypothetical protein